MKVVFPANITFNVSGTDQLRDFLAERSLLKGLFPCSPWHWHRGELGEPEGPRLVMPMAGCTADSSTHAHGHGDLPLSSWRSQVLAEITF